MGADVDRVEWSACLVASAAFRFCFWLLFSESGGRPPLSENRSRRTGKSKKNASSGFAEVTSLTSWAPKREGIVRGCSEELLARKGAFASCVWNQIANTGFGVT